MTSPTAPTVSVMVLKPVVLTLAGFGVDVATLLARAGLTPELLSTKGARVPIERELALWRAADELTGEPALGLRIARQFEPGVLGSLGYLLRNSQSVEALVARAQRFCRLMDDLAEVRLEVHSDEARITFSRGSYPVPPSGVECLLAVISLTGHTMWPAARARSVQLAHERRAEPSLYRDRFGCPVEFGADTNAIVFDAAWLAVPAQGVDPKLARVLEAHTEHLLAQLPSPQGFADRARAQLRSLLSAGQVSPEALARALATSERTLRRRLKQEDTSYLELLDDARHALSLALLLRADLSLAQVAEQLGFADTSTFHRSFKRWTGMTPAVYQKQRA